MWIEGCANKERGAKKEGGTVSEQVARGKSEYEAWVGGGMEGWTVNSGR